MLSRSVLLVMLEHAVRASTFRPSSGKYSNVDLSLCTPFCHLIRLDKCVDTHSEESNVLTFSPCKLQTLKKDVNQVTQPIK